MAVGAQDEVSFCLWFRDAKPPKRVKYDNCVFSPHFETRMTVPNDFDQIKLPLFSIDSVLAKVY
jgi:hypothetical protein